MTNQDVVNGINKNTWQIQIQIFIILKAVFK